MAVIASTATVVVEEDEDFMGMDDVNLLTEAELADMDVAGEAAKRAFSQDTRRAKARRQAGQESATDGRAERTAEAPDPAVLAEAAAREAAAQAVAATAAAAVVAAATAASQAGKKKP